MSIYSIRLVLNNNLVKIEIYYYNFFRSGSMKKLSSIFSRKTIRDGALFCIVSLFIFSSCENFIKASDISREIDNYINYNNASSYVIKVNTPKNGIGIIKAPAGGETIKKVSDIFTVSFETNDYYEFIEWKIIDAVTKTQYQNGEYLKLDSTTQESAECTFIKAPAPGMQLCLVPLVTERPKIIDKSPVPGEAEAYRDSVIQIVFDHDMAEESLYYDENEIDELINEYNLTKDNFLPPDPNFQNCYGYTLETERGTETFYKVISLTDYNTKKSLLDKFNPPAFDNPSTLVLSMKENQLLAQGTQVYAILKKDLAYYQTKLIKQKDDTPWMFFVGDKQDKSPPILSNASIKAWVNTTPDLNDPSKDKEDKASFTNSNPPTLYNKSIYLDILVTDQDSGPASYFEMEISGVTDTSFKKTLKIYYNKVTSAKARKYEGLYKLTDFEDGTYKIDVLAVYDKKLTKYRKDYTNQYFKIDTSAPDVKCVFSQTDNADLSITVDRLNRPQNDTTPFTDIRKMIIKSRKYTGTPNNSGWDSIQGVESPNPVQATRISNLEMATKYQFEIELINALGNSVIKYYQRGTPAYPLENVNYEIIRTKDKSDKLQLSWEAPQGNYEGVLIQVTDVQENKTITFIFDDYNKTCAYTQTTNITYGKKYQVKLYSYSDFYSRTETSKALTPYEVPEFYTTPTEPSPKPVVSPRVNDKIINSTISEGSVIPEGSIKITGIKPNTSYITHNKLYYKQAGTSSPYTYYEETENDEALIEGLTPGKTYTIQVIPYINDIEGRSYTLTGGVALPGLVKNVNIISVRKVQLLIISYSLEIFWNKPEGDFDSYTISYSRYTGTAWTEPQTFKDINKNVTSYIITGLNPLTKYKIQISTCRKHSNVETTTNTFEKIVWTNPAKIIEISSSSYAGTNVDGSAVYIDYVYPYPDQAPYNAEGTKFYLCYGKTEEEALSGIYKIEQKNFQNYSRIFISDTIHTNILNNIGTLDCYFTIQTQLPEQYDNAALYSNIINVSLPPKPVTKPDNVDKEFSYYWNVNECDVSPGSVTLRWKNPEIYDSVEIWYNKRDQQNETLIASLLSGEEQYTFNYSDYDINCDDTKYEFVVVAKYKDLESKLRYLRFVPASPDLNLRTSIQPQDQGYVLTLNWNKLNDYICNGFSVRRYEISYTKDGDPAIGYIGGKVKLNSSSYSFTWENGYDVNTEIATSEILEPGTYVIKFKSYGAEYHSTGSLKYSIQELTTNTITVTIPEP